MGGRRHLIAATLSFLAVFGFAGEAYACSCADRPVKQALRQADAAIVGRLVEVIPRGEWEADFRYRVQRVRKPGRGIAQGRTVAVRATTSGAACGLPTAVDRHYGLLLFWSEGRWTGNSCNLVAPKELSCAS